LKRCRPAQFQNYDAGRLSGRKSRDVPKVAIKGNQRSSFGDANFKETIVRTAIEFLLMNARHIMSVVT
jgi:hypothetical protein